MIEFLWLIIRPLSGLVFFGRQDCRRRAIPLGDNPDFRAVRSVINALDAAIVGQCLVVRLPVVL